MPDKILVDSNVILDIFTENSDWFSWSSSTLSEYADNYLLAINPIIYAEISIGFHRIELLEEVLSTQFFLKLNLPWEAAFLAGKCFLKYRQKKGDRRSPLPDFYIGAHAAVANMPLMTRDKQRYRTYFPSVSLICP